MLRVWCLCRVHDICAYLVQIVNHPFFDDINMRIDHATVHSEFAIAMHQRFGQRHNFLEITGRCQEGQSLRHRLHTNQITICLWDVDMRQCTTFKDTFRIRIPCLFLDFGPGITASSSIPPLNSCTTTDALVLRKQLNSGNRLTFVIASHDTMTKSATSLHTQTHELTKNKEC